MYFALGALNFELHRGTYF